MSDREFGGNDDLSLPKGKPSPKRPQDFPSLKLTQSITATVQKIILEILPQSSGVAFAREARDLLIECCVEFIRMLSSEANDISEKEARKTIAVEHIEKALKELDFEEYIPDILAVADEFKDQQKTREKRVNKMEMSGLSDEQLAAMQEEMFASARQKFAGGEGEGEGEGGV